MDLRRWRHRQRHPAGAGDGVPDRLGHQDLHRGARHAVPRRGPARPGRPDRAAPGPARARRRDSTPAAVAHRRPATRAARRRVGQPARPGRRRAAGRPGPGRAGAAHRPALPLLQPRPGAARRGGRPAARRHLGRGAGRPGAHPARADRHRPVPDRACRDRVPGRRVLRRGPPGTTRRLRRGGPRRAALEHRDGHGPLGRVPGRPGGGGPGRRGARRDDCRGDVLAAHAHRRVGLVPASGWA